MSEHCLQENNHHSRGLRTSRHPLRLGPRKRLSQWCSTDDLVVLLCVGGESSEVEVGVNIAYKKKTTAPVNMGEEGSDKQEHSLAADTSPKSRIR